MNFDFHPDLAAFRAEVRAFIRANLRAEVRERFRRGMPIDRPTMATWHAKLVEKGWAARGWPQEHGGAGFSLEQQYVFNQELASAGAPLGHISWGFSLVAPAVLQYGTEEQKRRFLPPILRGETYWCQGFSEPNAGSDLASLTCRADRDGDHYVINGSKIWTSNATTSDWMFGIFRTSVEDRPQKGITMLFIDMCSEGIAVVPIRTFEGGSEINQTFFTDVRVPVENRIGAEGEGWEISKYLLGRERYNVAQVAVTKQLLARVKYIASKEETASGRLIDDPDFAARLYRFEIELAAFEAVEHYLLYDSKSEGAMDPERMTILKIRGSVLHQGVTRLAMDALGPMALPDIPAPQSLLPNEESVGPEYAAGISREYYNTRKTTIYGGSNEIQKNIVAKGVLGL